jgi:redox-sensitive bicupin YhaK (pirin superfamily)
MQTNSWYLPHSLANLALPVPSPLESIRGSLGIFLVAGQPLDQKVVQYGPFVLNTQEEVYQAMLDIGRL